MAACHAPAGTVVALGAIKSFSSPTDPNLDLTGNFDYAVNFSANDPVRTVGGLTFTPDTQTIPGASFIGPQTVSPWQAKPELGATADATALEEIMQDIRWANSASGEKLQATLTVTPNVPYKIQLLISGNCIETRNWDIRFNGQNAVDEISSLGAMPGATYAGNRCTLWTYEFTPTTATLTVEMGNFFGASAGGDRNPIWQALTLERLYLPPTPGHITLSATRFFPNQTATIGSFTVTDAKFGATHTLSFAPGTGDADNARFSLRFSQLRPSPYNFSTAPPGTTYAIRIRATDALDTSRFLEMPFILTLAEATAPASVVLNATSLSSGLLPGQLIALLSATDAEAFDRHSFVLASGPGDSNNPLFVIAGNELRLASALPAGLLSLSLRLRATDLAGLFVETSVILPIEPPRVSINEVLCVATGGSLPLDENGYPQDWIELRNDLPQPVALAGWTLTDEPDLPAKWAFPATATIPPNGFYLIFASGSGASPAGGIPHANFSLSQSGEHLVLSRPDGTVACDFEPPGQFPNTTWGPPGGGTDSAFLRTPTPGAANSQLAAAGSNAIRFSVPHGFKTAAFPLTLTATLAGSLIRYTLDGSTPTPTSPVYATPLLITPMAGTVKSGTRIVRAFATHPDAAYTPVATQTYLFVNGVAAPASDGIIGQTNFVFSIKNNATYGPQLDDALLALPALSVVNSSADLPLAETESSMELFDPAGGESGFTIPTGVIRSGTTSLNYAKGSMSARFRGEYGATALNYPLYGNHPHDALGAATEFQELRLRSGSHDTHSWLGTAENPPVPYGSPAVTRSGDAQYVRNIWIEDMQLLMGQPGKHGRLVNLFFNGNYYGIYHIQEHPDDDYMGSYFPGSSTDYHFTGGATTGSTHGSESWTTIWAQLKASLTNYTEAKRWIDMTSLADYMILSFYAGNDWDWSAQHNWGAAGPRLPDSGGWKFFQQDQDVSLQDVNADCTDQNVPDGIFTALMAHPDFKTLFRDRAYKHLFHDGVLTPAKAAAYYDLRASTIQTAIVAETARWQPTSSVGPLPWDRDGEWTVERNYLMNTYFPQRSAIQLNQFRSRGWYPVEAPEMTRHGGPVAAGSPLYLTGPAGSTVYYTLDGSDPRLPGGSANPAALSYLIPAAQQILVAPYNDVPGQGAIWKFRVAATYPGDLWKDPSFSDSAWTSGKPEFGYGDGDEVTNLGTIDIDPATAGIQHPLTSYFRHSFHVADPAAVTGLTIRVKRDDGALIYLNGREIFRTSMPTGSVSFTTLATAADDDGNTWFTKTLSPADYTLLAGQNLIAAEVHNNTSTSSDISFDLELTASLPVAPQPITINGPVTLKARAKTGAEWSAVNEATFYLTGTQPATAANLTLSEIQYQPEGTGQDDAEFLEFTNTGTTAIDLNGVRVGGAVLFTFPPGIILLPGEQVTIAKDQALFDARYRQVNSPWYVPNIRLAGSYTGSLANSGEEIITLDAANAPIATFSYDDSGAWPGRADGRGSSLELANPAAAPASPAAKSAFLGNAANWRPSSEFHGSPGRLGSGPDRRVIINEILSASLPPATDFIELHNPGDSPQAIGGWFLSDTSDDYRKFKIPAETSLAAGAFLVLDEAAFNNPLSPDCIIPFALSSAGDDVFLLQADSAGNLLKFADRVEFAAAPGDMPYGRLPDGSGGFELVSSPTRDSANRLQIPAYAAWLAGHFPVTATTAETALAADPDQDGLTNLAEFALGRAPLAADANPLTFLPTAPGSPLELRFTIRNDIPGLTATLQVATELTSWDTSETFIQRLTETPLPDGTTVVTARLVPPPGCPNALVRLALQL